MNKSQKYPDLHPLKWENNPAITDREEYQIDANAKYNPYTRDDMEEQRKRDYYRGFEDEVELKRMKEKKEKFHKETKAGKVQKHKGPGKFENERKTGHHHHGSSFKPRYPERGNTDPFSGESWVY